jgi:uncharacterized protein
MLILIIVVFGVLSFAVSSRLKSKFKRYSQTTLAGGMSGREVAEKMLADNRIYDVKVVSTRGTLTDHYNPLTKTIALSEEVYYGRSAASAAVAAHECGHAVQHAKAYSFLQLRSAMVPIQNVSAQVLNMVIMISIFGGAFLYGTFPIDTVLLIIIACYFVITMFSLVTLPVEFDASKRALVWMTEKGITRGKEHAMAKDALKWAAMTYVVAALGSLAMLAYYIMIFLGNRR